MKNQKQRRCKSKRATSHTHTHTIHAYGDIDNANAFMDLNMFHACCFCFCCLKWWWWFESQPQSRLIPHSLFCVLYSFIHSFIFCFLLSKWRAHCITRHVCQKLFALQREKTTILFITHRSWLWIWILGYVGVPTLRISCDRCVSGREFWSK